MIVLLYKTKKELKTNMGKRLRYRETSCFGEEYREDTVLYGVGPSEYVRKWYATVTIRSGLIMRVV